MISFLGSRRLRPSWLSEDEWESVETAKRENLAIYSQAKLEADEYLTALAARRKQDPRPFQAINLRPGTLTDEPATRKVELGKTSKGRGFVTREDVAIVADQLLARADTEGWIDLLNGEVPVEEAIENVAVNKIDTVEGEDVDGMVKRFFP